MTTETARHVGEHLAEVTYETTGWLAHLADAFSAMRDQRDSARRWAVEFEQSSEELTRRITVALMLLDEASCECKGAQRNPTLVCTRHAVEDVLRMGVQR